jgi:hypothetical protein
MTEYKIKIKMIIIMACLSILPVQVFADGLLTSANMTYLGAFTIPSVGTTSPKTSLYSGTAVGFNPSGNGGKGSLFINGFNKSGTYLGEISIPTTLYTGTDKTKLPSASFLQGSPYYWDVSEGHYTNVGSGGANITSDNGWGTGGILVTGSSILVTSYGLYVASGGSYLPMFYHKSLNLSTTGVYSGNYGLNVSNYLGSDAGITGSGTGDFQSGALGSIPSAYQSQLGGTTLAGGNSFDMSIVSRTSYGPSIIAFNPSNFAAANTVPSSVNANALVAYPSTHQNLGKFSTDANKNYSMADHYGALIFPPGTRSILVVGVHGSGGPGYACSGRPTTGVPCYGIPTNDCTLAAKSGYCYDPENAGNTHMNTAWPYSNYVWAYDVGDASGNNTSGNSVPSANTSHPEKNNLTAVKLGIVKPWDVKPYAVWPLPDANNILKSNFVGEHGSGYSSGTYDPSTGNAYFTVYKGNDSNGQALPVIEVYKITGSSSSSTIQAPSGVKVQIIN